MKILVAVDDSPSSRTAIAYVKHATWAPGSTFLVVSACPPIWIGPGEEVAVDAIAELNRQQEIYHRDTAERSAEELVAAGLEAEGICLPGDPRHAIVDHARQGRFDLVVVGSRGRSGMVQLLLGSVASHVVTHAPCSVLVVRDPAQRQDAGGG
jgi:nucleotide-binding universal stress UspA family protein